MEGVLLENHRETEVFLCCFIVGLLGAKNQAPAPL